ncbi:MAG: hypothetical protein RLZZ338_1570, partial [Cyanobacteriota bacterium]
IISGVGRVFEGYLFVGEIRVNPPLQTLIGGGDLSPTNKYTQPNYL